MNSGLFGPRGLSNSYYTNKYSNSYVSPYRNPYNNPSTLSYPNYPNGYLSSSNVQYPSQYSSQYPVQYSSQYPSQYPYYGQYQSSSNPLISYNWGSPGVVLAPKGLESILIAILVLVVLDLVLVRPLKGS